MSANYTIAADEQGAYEIPIPANTVATIRVGSADSNLSSRFQVMVHTDKPVYVRRGTTVSVADPKAIICPERSWVDIPVGPRSGSTLALISAADSIVSVYRS